MNDFFFDLQRFNDNKWSWDESNSVFTYTDTSSGRIATCTVSPTGSSENPFGDGFTFSGSSSSTDITFTITDGSESESYVMALNGTAKIAFNDENKIKLTVTSGTAYSLRYSTSTSEKVPFILLSGAYSSDYSYQPITLGENGPAIKYDRLNSNATITTTLSNGSLTIKPTSAVLKQTLEVIFNNFY